GRLLRGVQALQLPHLRRGRLDDRAGGGIRTVFLLLRRTLALLAAGDSASGRGYLPLPPALLPHHSLSVHSTRHQCIISHHRRILPDCGCNLRLGWPGSLSARMGQRGGARFLRQRGRSIRTGQLPHRKSLPCHDRWSCSPRVLGYSLHLRGQEPSKLSPSATPREEAAGGGVDAGRRSL
ncbi:hypothetical protein PMAYCL1PPCAC_00669, partial [Pristionchus mayeri]